MIDRRSSFEPWNARCAGPLPRLSLFLVPATFTFHNYRAADAARLQGQDNHFYKNVAMPGGLVFLMGAAGMDRRRRA
jgi:hypothetical protein